MRSFILGLLVGGFAVHLWHRANRSRTSRPVTPRVRIEPSATTSEPRAELHSSATIASAATTNASPGYQPASLDECSQELRVLAEQLFAKTASLAGQTMCQKENDGYRFRSESAGTAARIIIYQRHHGTETGPFPMLHDGVYVLLRTRASAPNTLGIGMRQEERFNYRRVNEINLDDVAREIADLLHVAKVV
jgi:hypothetical protein